MSLLGSCNSLTFDRVSPHDKVIPILRNGMTLVEVVAAMLLAATLLTTALTAYGRSVRQQKSVRDRSEAIRLADQLLATWAMAGPISLQLPDPLQQTSGNFEKSPGWKWKLTRQNPLSVSSSSQGRFQLESFLFEVIKNPNDDAHIVISLELPSRVTVISPAPGGN